MTSPSMILSMAIPPASGVKLLCMAFTEPFEAAVVVTPHRMLLAMPKRVSLPSSAPTTLYSLASITVKPTSSKISIAVKIIHPCRLLPIITLFVAIFPGNVAQYLEGTDAFGLDTDAKRLARLPFQVVLVLWALWSTDEHVRD